MMVSKLQKHVVVCKVQKLTMQKSPMISDSLEYSVYAYRQVWRG